MYSIFPGFRGGPAMRKMAALRFLWIEAALWRAFSERYVSDTPSYASIAKDSCSDPACVSGGGGQEHR